MSTRASVPEATPIACGTPQYAAIAASKRSTCGAEDELLARQHLGDGGPHRGADRRVLRAQVEEGDASVRS